NFESISQLRALTGAVRAVRPEILIAVDHEGGRVQRFRDGFTRIPPMRALAEVYARDAQDGRALARHTGWLMASELIASGLDFSFAPVLDLDCGRSTVIGDRSFGSTPDVVTALAGALIDGLHEAGMAAVGKHFPGHGHVVADSHLEIPVDERPLDALRGWDMQPFQALMPSALDAIMPAHVIYPAVDDYPAGFSTVWLQEILRGQMGFDGVIFSDDLSMEGASVAGGYAGRAAAALAAGCDMVLVCNQREGAREVVEWLRSQPIQASRRLDRMRATLTQPWDEARAAQVRERLAALCAS
ncbi:MAG: beta-N-acetylhexosaminidase, partial [Gammaproteobacteria bacterium]|nr:beta-N-acetylhexosaminidase [Gammaproteobacteria bacterium]